MSEMDHRAEALNNAIQLLQAHHFDISDILAAAEYLRSGLPVERRNPPMPAEQMREKASPPSLLHVALRRKLAEALGKGDDTYLDAELIDAVWDMRDHRGRLEEELNTLGAHLDATRQEYKRELAQQSDLVHAMFNAARAVAESTDLQHGDDEVRRLRILVEQATRAGWWGEPAGEVNPF